MNKINLNNYELFAIDYIENNLDAETRKEFEIFLKNNPEIKKEILGLSEITIPAEKIDFNEKFELKKSPVEGLTYFEYLAISDIEKTITEEEKKELEQIICNNADKMSEYQLFTKTKLKKENFVFPNKNQLKKSNVIFIQRMYKAVAAIAAIFIIFFGYKFLLNNNNKILLGSINDYNSSFAISAINSSYEISFDELRIAKNTNVSINDDNNLSDTKNNIHINIKNKKQQTVITNNIDKNTKLPLPQKNIKLAKLDKSLPELTNYDNTLSSNEKKKNVLDVKLKDINTVNAINLAFKGFDLMTESDNRIKIGYQKNKKIFVLQSRRRSYKISW